MGGCAVWRGCVQLSLPLGEPFGGFAQRVGKRGLVGGGIIQSEAPARFLVTAQEEFLPVGRGFQPVSRRFQNACFVWGCHDAGMPVVPIAQRLELTACLFRLSLMVLVPVIQPGCIGYYNDECKHD